jgi:hypothetical protein
MSKKWLLLAPVAGALGVSAGVGVDGLSAANEAKQDLKPAVSLPVSRVVLFNSGVGYFSRSGEVEGDARVDLTFPESDVNDLLKSMVLEDFGKGRISAVSYDSREPVTRTLSSFAVNLNGNPTFSGILGQLRGERIEVAVSPTTANQPGKLTGTIVGIETQKVPSGSTPLDAEVLNMWCAEGMRAVRVADIQSLRFSNPVTESEFRRALEVLALSHDSQKKSVSLHFAGEGKRKVQVGYVIEAPIWKTSYRLILDEKSKPYLQGWAMVENPTDEDWNSVKMALISGRPISFRMDLYNPLYINRPVVEPELFASLRPVTYRGGFGYEVQLTNGDPGHDPRLEPARPSELMQRGLATTKSRNELYQLKGSPESLRARNANGAMGLQDSVIMGGSGKGAVDPTHLRRTTAELAQRVETGSVWNAATAGSLGDFFQYVIDQPVTLRRQKSALLPIVGKDVEGAKVSIYNERVQVKHPLLGLRFKNTTGAHLNQGPITVFEGSTYAGDTQVLNVQPNEERLLSYAIDLGTEVDPKAGPGAQKITSVKAVKGVVTTVTKVSEEKTYKVVNRSQTDRTLVVEHPNRTSQQFKLVGTDKPAEETPEVYRFQIAVKAGETRSFTVREERDLSGTVALTNGAEDQLHYVVNLAEASPALKQQLLTAINTKHAWDAVRRELNQVVADLQRLNADQDRIRKNLRETPKDAEVYATYLKKLSHQEKEIDSLTDKQKKLMADEFRAKKAYEDFLPGIDG